MKQLVRAQRLAFVATVCPDGSPNLSPKGTTTVWDDDHLIFADLRSPGTVANLATNPAVEVNVVDIFSRKGYRFNGTATVFTAGDQYRAFIDYFSGEGLFDVPRRIRAVVLVRVVTTSPLISPAYDRAVTEGEVIDLWKTYCLKLLREDDQDGSIT